MTKLSYLLPKTSIKFTQGTIAVVDFQGSNSSRVNFYRAPTPDCDWRSNKQKHFFCNEGEHQVPKSQDSFYRIREIQFGAISFHWAITLQPTVNENWGQTAKNCHSYFCEERHILFVANCTNLSPRKSGQVFDSKFVPGYKQSTLSAIRTVLLTRNLPEEKIYKFFSSLRNNNISGAPVEVLLAPFMRKQSKYQKRLSDLLTGYFQWRTTPGKLK